MTKTWGTPLGGKLRQITLEHELKVGQAIRLTRSDQENVAHWLVESELGKEPDTLNQILDALPKEGLEPKFVKVNIYVYEKLVNFTRIRCDVEIHAFVKEASPLSPFLIGLVLAAIISAIVVGGLVVVHYIAQEFYEWSEEGVGAIISIGAVFGIIVIILFFLLLIWGKRIKIGKIGK